MITSPINVGLRRYGPASGSDRSFYLHPQVRAPGLRHKLPHTLVMLPVLLLLVRISLFVKGHVETDFGYIDSVAIIEISMVGITILLLLRDAATGSVLRAVSKAPVGWLLFYYLLATLSALWSLMPSYTFFRGIEVLSQFIAAFVILAQARSFAAREFIFLVAGAIAIVLEIGGAMRLIGGIGSIASLHTCSYSNVGLVLFVYCLAEYPTCEISRKRTLFWFGFIGLAAIVLGTSATTNLAAVLGILIAVIISARKGMQPITVLALCLLLFLAVSTMMARDTVISWLMPNKTVEQIESFTGRRELWDELNGVWRENPLLGRGFVASTRTGDLRLTNAHNALLQTMLDTGIVGTCILSLALTALGISGIRRLNQLSPGSAGFAAAFVALIPVNVTVPVWGVGWDETVLAWAFLVGLHTFSARPSNLSSFAPVGKRRDGRRFFRHR